MSAEARLNLYAAAVQRATRSTMTDRELDLELARLATEYPDVVEAIANDRARRLEQLTAAKVDRTPVVVEAGNRLVGGTVTHVDTRLVIVRGEAAVPHPVRLDDITAVREQVVA